MLKKIIFIILFFYFLTLIQISFLVHFQIFGIVPNFVLIAVIFINLLENPEKKLGVISNFIAGFYLDVFSLSSFGFFGFYTLVLVGISIFLKFILKKYVKITILKRF
ncbi:MAG: rod shape-determining protein MreD [bacterium]